MSRALAFDEAAAKSLYDANLSDTEIAARLGVGRNLVSAWRYRRGLGKNLPPLKTGTRPEVTVVIPPGLHSAARSRESAEPAPREASISSEGG